MSYVQIPYPIRHPHPAHLPAHRPIPRHRSRQHPDCTGSHADAGTVVADCGTGTVQGVRAILCQWRHGRQRVAATVLNKKANALIALALLYRRTILMCGYYNTGCGFLIFACANFSSSDDHATDVVIGNSSLLSPCAPIRGARTQVLRTDRPFLTKSLTLPRCSRRASSAVNTSQ